jgi:hypothetical protein
MMELGEKTISLEGFDRHWAASLNKHIPYHCDFVRSQSFDFVGKGPSDSKHQTPGFSIGGCWSW